MNVICTWVKGWDGALVLEWARADASKVHREDSEVHSEADDFDATCAFTELDHDTGALTLVGV